MIVTVLIAVAALALGVFIGHLFWPRAADAMAAVVRSDLENALTNADGGLFNANSRVRERERQIAVMTVARDPAQMHVAALRAAGKIEDIFARGSSSVADRKTDIAAVVRRQVDDALKGGEPEFI